MPTVDAVVPSYNYAPYLESCVKSLLEQEGADVRVLIIDDASTDSTPEVGQRLAAADSRVTYRRHENNHGHIATYNEGLLEWAHGEYVLLISADDMFAPGALGRAVALLDRHRHASFAHGRQIRFDNAPPELTATTSAGGDAYRLHDGWAFISGLCATAQNPVETPTVIVRTSAQHKVGGYESTLPHTADLEMWLRLATCGDVIELDAVQAFKRHHGRNMQLSFLSNPEGDMRERREAFQMFFRHVGAAFPNAATELARAERALAAELFWRAASIFEAGCVAEAERLLQLAASVDPAITRSSHWRRMSIKRKLGYRLWSLVQGLAGRAEQQRAS
jgi:glycosyltransferase involved in cell wall biosynthesis